jgi:L-gulonate 5-dehydrogenase
MQCCTSVYTYGRGATVSIDAACAADSLWLLLNATGNAGRVVTMGFSTAAAIVNQFLITSKEWDIKGSRLQNQKFGDAIALILDRKLNLSHSISHTFPLTEAQKAFDFIDTQDHSIRKIVLTFDQY